MNHAITIIIPTYNRKDRLHKTIQSVLNQTFQDFELLICDDGSTDGTEGMVKTFNDPRIRWIAGQNSGGPAVPRNKGIREAKGKWLAFLDSDDLWLSEKLEKQMKIIHAENVKAVCTNASVMQEGKTLEKPYFNHTSDKLYAFADMLTVNHVICSSMLLHRSIAERFGGFPENEKFKAIEDYALWLSASMMTNVYYINEALIIYRDEPHDSIRGGIVDAESIKHKRIVIECFNRTKYIQKGKLYYRSLILRFLINLHFSSYILKIFSILKGIWR